jgi:DNA polymerase I-like protein with 3'-5' exonuclease and polymerase domains
MAAPKLSRPAAFVVSDLGTLLAVVQKALARGTRIYADTETTGFNPRQKKLVAIQLYQDGAQQPVIIDWRSIDRKDGAAKLLNQLAGLTWVFHNAKFDLQWLSSVGIHPRKVFDTYVAEQVIHGMSADEKLPLKLTDLAGKYCGVAMSKDERSWFIDLDERPDEWDAPFPDEEVAYMALDVTVLPDIFNVQCNELFARNLMDTAVLEMRVVPAIAAMESDGVYINVDGWREVIREQEALAARLESELLTSDLAMAILESRKRKYEEERAALWEWEQERDHFLEGIKSEWELDDAWDRPKWGDVKKEKMAQWKARHPRPPTPNGKLLEVNFGSSQQLIQGFEELGIPIPMKRNKETGEMRPTTDADSLEKLVPKYPVLRPYIDWRRAEKVVNTYGEKLLARVEPDGRIHPRFNQIGAETGRMSSSEPNWQNIPARTEVGRRLRRCVTCPPGHKLLDADYSTIELRILAELADDKVMLKLFEDGADLHTFTARRMFKIPDSVSDAEIKGDGCEPYLLPNGMPARSIAKNINFGIAYGQSAFGFALMYNIDTKEAEGFINAYYDAYPGLKAYIAKLGDRAVNDLCSQTVTGRKRYYELPAPPSQENWEEFKAWRRLAGSVRRQGGNHPIQGSSADITKEAVARLYEWRVQTGTPFRFVAVVHDEILLEVADEYVDIVAEAQADLMLAAARKYLPRVAIPRPEPKPSLVWEH